MGTGINWRVAPVAIASGVGETANAEMPGGAVAYTTVAAAAVGEAATVTVCAAGCGVMVRTKEGRAIKLEGNPDHPLNQGRLCSRGLQAITATYSPDRFKTPLKGNAAVAWDAAVSELGAALAAARTAGKKAMYLGYPQTGATSDVVAIWAYDATMPVADANMDQTIVGPQTWAQLMGSPTPIWPATCYWTILTGPSNIADPSDPYAVAAGLGVGDNIFVWTCENGPCWSSPTVDTEVIQMMMITGLDEGTQHQPLLVGTRYSNNCSTWGPGASADYCCSMHTAKRCHFT